MTINIDQICDLIDKNEINTIKQILSSNNINLSNTFDIFDVAMTERGYTFCVGHQFYVKDNILVHSCISCKGYICHTCKNNCSMCIKCIFDNQD